MISVSDKMAEPKEIINKMGQGVGMSARGVDNTKDMSGDDSGGS